MRDAHGHEIQTSIISAIPIGAHLVTRRLGYTHHGIYVGEGRVVHYAGLAGVLSRGPVEEVGLAAFVGAGQVEVRVEPTARFASDVVAARARSRLGEGGYKLISNNCEHFCAWCLHGVSRSEQVEQLLALPRFLAFLFRRSISSVNLLNAAYFSSE
jgi:Lecithin retinol acyltransferase